MIHLHDVAAVFLISLTFSGLLVVCRNAYMPRLRDRGDLAAPQALHTEATPRLGGVGIIFAISLAIMSMASRESDPLQWTLTVFAMSLAPVFFAGLAEDIGYPVSPRNRLIAAACSSLVMVAGLHVWLPPMGLAGLDMLLNIMPVAVVLTIIGTTGICHAFNLIDGANGLAGGIGIMIAAGLWWVAQTNGVPALATISLVAIAAMAGFLVFNWPFGRIFMGDAGAYSFGHVLGWLTILLVWQVQSLSVLAIALMFFWPVADTGLAIWRRLHKKRKVSAPDRLHFHQLVYRLLSLAYGDQFSNKMLNSLTSLIILPFAGAPVVTAIVVADSGYLALAGWIGFSILFVSTYLAGIALFRARPWPNRAILRESTLQPGE